jgi:uncharacterized protein (TIGR03083 family)
VDKSQLLDEIRRERAAFSALIAPLDDAQIAAPSLDAGWSIKDMIAHISLWERLCAGWLEDVARGDTPARPEVRDVDATNARDHEAAKDAPLATVRSASAEAHASLLAVIDALSDADLADEQRFGWPAWQMIAGNSSEHYAEHADEITRFLSRG